MIYVKYNSSTGAIRSVGSTNNELMKPHIESGEAIIEIPEVIDPTRWRINTETLSLEEIPAEQLVNDLPTIGSNFKGGFTPSWG